MLGALLTIGAAASQRPVSLGAPSGSSTVAVRATASSSPLVAKQVLDEERSGTSTRLTQVLERQRAQTQMIERQYDQTQKQIATLRPSIWDKSLPAIFGVLGAVIASCGAYLLQRQRLAFDQREARRTAGTTALAEIKNFRSRQLNEFYAPLEALLRQVVVLRDELYERMRANPIAGVNFKSKQDPAAATGYSLWVVRGSTEVPFRLIDEMQFLHHHYPQLMPNVAEMVRINSLIVKLLHKSIGLVLHESVELSQKLGIFLAHQSVLEEVFKTVSSVSGAPLNLGYSTTYPRGLDALVKCDCDKLRNELEQWERTVLEWTGGVG
jgi:hypothetical protein